MNAAQPVNTQLAADPLQQLRDIHLPAPIGWWPPAPGWWALGAALLLILCVALYWLARRHRQRRYRRIALRQLDALHARWRQHGDPHLFVEELNRLLKQAALSAFPAQRVAALHGEAWLRFLDGTLPQPQFDRAELRPLAEVYRPDAAPPQVEELQRAAAYWLRRHRC